MYRLCQRGVVDLVSATDLVCAILRSIAADDWSQADDKRILGID
jgi:hypothetical protein